VSGNHLVSYYYHLKIATKDETKPEASLETKAGIG